ncbi:MAG: hypothetical protein HOM25_17770 [Rhodospirillaceae bacterium]|nr:hypothetical protein [Rhodospirillaceae bacterium]MBT5666816.1 hypothetical protein [Rhodospirillaceae bacterium]MBT5809989.1 hypothetical protein [Rhodospirillaceae bacterium]
MMSHRMKKSFLPILFLVFFATTAESADAVVSTVAANTYRVDGTHSIISTINCPIKARHAPVTLTRRTGFIRITFLQTANKVWCDAAVAPRAPKVQKVLLINIPRKHRAKLRHGRYDQEYPVRKMNTQRRHRQYNPARPWASATQNRMRHDGTALNRYKPARQRFIVVIER